MGVFRNEFQRVTGVDYSKMYKSNNADEYFDDETSC
jgi:hypothetical protein